MAACIPHRIAVTGKNLQRDFGKRDTHRYTTVFLSLARDVLDSAVDDIPLRHLIQVTHSGQPTKH